MTVGALQRGNVVIVNFSQTNPAAQVRPAVVVQNDRDNGRMANTIVAQVTTTIHRAGQLTQLLIDPTHSDWSASGLRRASVINCSNLATIQQRDVTRTIGTLSASTLH